MKQEDWVYCLDQQKTPSWVNQGILDPFVTTLISIAKYHGKSGYKHHADSCVFQVSER